MKLIYVALLCPVVITVFALLVQAYFWYGDVLHPLMSFNGAALQNDVSLLLGPSISDNSFLNDGNLKSGLNLGLANMDDVYLKYVIHIVAVSSKDITPYQSKVVWSIRKHLLKALGTLQHPSVEFKAIQSILFGNELNNLISYQQAEADDVLEPYLSSHDVNTYISSPDSVYQRSTRQMLDCTLSTSCKVLTFAYFLPDFTGHAAAHSDEYNSTKSLAQYKALQLIDTPIVDLTLQQTSDIIYGLIVSQLGCFTTLDLQSKQQYNPADANVIYNAATNTMQCLQKLLDIPNLHNNETIVDHACVDRDTCSAGEQASPIESDRALTLSATQHQQFQRNRIARILHNALSKLQALIQLHGYNTDIFALLTLTTQQSHAYLQIFEILKELKTALTADNSPRICTANTTCMHNIYTLIHKFYTLVNALDTDPAGGLKAPAPMEQHFAIFGPYWLPIVVPVYRALKSMASM